MNTDQLQCVIRENRCLSAVARRVYSADTLPNNVNTFPSAFICNTDPSYLPGKHWIVFWLQDPVTSEYYDSFGNLPGYYSVDFDTFLKQNTEMCVYNNVAVQKYDTDTCGYHVLFYLLMKCKNMKLSDIINVLKKCHSPDQYVFEYVSNVFKCI